MLDRQIHLHNPTPPGPTSHGIHSAADQASNAGLPGRRVKLAALLPTSRLRAALYGAALIFWAPCLALAQVPEGSTGAALGGAALGAFSGSALGLVGSLEPCNRSMRGTRCARMTTALGGAVGLVSGAVLGSRSTGALDDRVRGSATGAVVGALVGFGLKVGVRQYDWPDVAAGAVVGAALGAAPKGAGLGFVAGTAVGGLLWLSGTGYDLPDMIGLSLIGAAVGGLANWVIGAARADGEGITLTIPLQVRF